MDKKKATAHFKKAILLSYLSPLGTAREERSHGLSGGVGGVLGMGKGYEKEKKLLQRHPGINKIARWAIWHIFLTSLDAPYFASKTKKYAVSASLRSAPSVARGCRW